MKTIKVLVELLYKKRREPSKYNLIISKEPVCSINGSTNNFKSLTDEGDYREI
jgi:hypothetical protein